MNNIANINALIQFAQRCIDAGNYYDAASMLSQVACQLNNLVAARNQYGNRNFNDLHASQWGDKLHDYK